MPTKPKSDTPESEEAIDPVLRENFARLMGKKAIHALRKEMADKGIEIGVSTIQRAMRGSDGLRVESLDKFARFFGVERHRLLMPDLGEAARGDWPFKRVDRARWDACDEGDRGYIEHAMLRSIEECEKARGADKTKRPAA